MNSRAISRTPPLLRLFSIFADAHWDLEFKLYTAKKKKIVLPKVEIPLILFSDMNVHKVYFHVKTKIYKFVNASCHIFIFVIAMLTLHISTKWNCNRYYSVECCYFTILGPHFYDCSSCHLEIIGGQRSLEGKMYMFWLWSRIPINVGDISAEEDAGIVVLCYFDYCISKKLIKFPIKVNQFNCMDTSRKTQLNFRLFSLT